MKFTIKHEIRGRIRIHNCQKTMSADQADELQYYLITKDFVTSVKIYDRTNDIVICYDASRSEILTALKEFYHGIITVPDNDCRTIKYWNFNLTLSKCMNSFIYIFQRFDHCDPCS